MNEETVEVDARRYKALCECYSGDLLGRNKCKPVAFANRLWTVTGTASGGEFVPTANLHELVLPEHYEGPTGPYPFDSDGVFYKGQLVKARGRSFVMSGRSLTVVCTGSASESDDAGDAQLNLLDWREPKATAPVRKKKQNVSANGQKSSKTGPTRKPKLSAKKQKNLRQRRKAT